MFKPPLNGYLWLLRLTSQSKTSTSENSIECLLSFKVVFLFLCYLARKRNKKQQSYTMRTRQ